MLKTLLTSPYREHAVVTRKRTGLGSDLVSVLGALEYARKTSRDVVIDWRNSRYLGARRPNLFPHLFAVPDVIDGVRVHVAPDGFWMPRLRRPVDLMSGKTIDDETFHDEMTHAPRPVARSVIVTRPMHYLPHTDIQRAWLTCFTLDQRVQSAVDDFAEAHMTGRHIVGVHIRHGNGEDLGSGRNDLIAGDVEALAARCLARIDAHDAGERTIFLCTDSLELRRAFMMLDSRVVCFDSQIGSGNSGPIHTAKHGLKGAYDALSEMVLLSRCDRLYYTPSWFSHYARVMGDFVTPPVNLNDDSDYGAEALYWKRLGRTAPAA